MDINVENAVWVSKKQLAEIQEHFKRNSVVRMAAEPLRQETGLRCGWIPEMNPDKGQELIVSAIETRAVRFHKGEEQAAVVIHGSRGRSWVLRLEWLDDPALTKILGYNPSAPPPVPNAEISSVPLWAGVGLGLTGVALIRQLAKKRAAKKQATVPTTTAPRTQEVTIKVEEPVFLRV